MAAKKNEGNHSDEFKRKIFFENLGSNETLDSLTHCLSPFSIQQCDYLNKSGKCFA